MSGRDDPDSARRWSGRRAFDVKRSITLLTGAALVVALGWTVHRFVGWRVIATIAQTIPASYWLAFTTLVALSYATRVVRLWRLLRAIKSSAHLARSAAVFFVHNGLASLLPARIGEAALPLLARRWMGIDWASVVGALAWWRLVDVAVVGAIALVLLAMGAEVLAPLYVLAFAACGLPLLAFWLRGFLLQAKRDDVKPSSRPRWTRFLHRALAGMPASAAAVTTDLVLAVVAWVLKIAAFTALMSGTLDASLAGTAATMPDLRQLAAAALAGDVAGALPTPSLAGVGPFEAGIVLGLRALDISLADSLSAAVVLHAALLGTIALGAVIGLLAGLLLDRRRPARRRP